MRKSIILSMLAFLLVISSLGVAPKKADADYTDNYNRLYYDLARLVYNAENDANVKGAIQYVLNDSHAPIDSNGKRITKFKVIDAVNLSTSQYHPMSKSSVTGAQIKLEDSGFKAMAVSIVGSNKVFVAISGTDSGDYSVIADARTAQRTLSANNPAQSYHAQLYLNYLIETKGWATKDFYLTGHSLGGWVTSKLYLDVRAANWLTPTEERFEYGGPVRASIEGVYNFNPLPLRKSQIDDTGQWDANKRGAYNSDIKNLYIDNEWLNAVADMHPAELDYIGVEGRITSEQLPYWSQIYYYKSNFGITGDLIEYYTHAADFKKSVREMHSIKSLKNYVN